MPFFRFIMAFWVTTRIDLHDLVLKDHIRFLMLSSAAALYSPLSKTLCFCSCLFFLSYNMNNMCKRNKKPNDNDD